MTPLHIHKKSSNTARKRKPNQKRKSASEARRGEGGRRRSGRREKRGREGGKEHEGEGEEERREGVEGEHCSTTIEGIFIDTNKCTVKLEAIGEGGDERKEAS